MQDSLIGLFMMLIIFLAVGYPMAWAAEKFPQKNVTLIVTREPGGSTDIQARGLQGFLQKYLGVPVVVENVTGGGGTVGYTRTFTSKPDGYTLMVYPFLSAMISEVQQEVKYKVVEYTPIAAFCEQVLGLVVNPEVYAGLPQFLEAAKGKTMNIGTSGHGSVSHLDAMFTCDTLKLNARYVPFGGGAENLNALVGKHIDATMVSVFSAYGLVSSGKLKILFVLSDKRSTTFPEFPTAKELGHTLPFIQFVVGTAGPPGVPKDIVKILEDAHLKTFEDPEFQAWAKKAKLEYAPLNSKGYKDVVDEGYKVLQSVKDKIKKM